MGFTHVGGIARQYPASGPAPGRRSFALATSDRVSHVPDTEREVRPGDWARLATLIRDIRIALLTTVDRDGHFHTRPVQTLQLEGRDTLWFFTDWRSPKVHEMERDVRVALGYADRHQHAYVAVGGSAALLRDPQKAKELWGVEQRAYYPDGPEDDRLALLRVSIERAEYWVAPGRVSYLLAAAKAAVTGVPAAVIGEHHKLE
jgi:general stress protein 26